MNFTKTILNWYGNNARDLPWRRTADPYLIWISEVILQQTRIGQGLGYYEKFRDQFPSVGDLANADEEDILKAWQGLGYYSRARNLHVTAKEIVKTHNGIFPDSYEKLIRLKGIGEYTAAAILSIAYGQSFPVVDGNVLRFFSRYFGIHSRIDTTEGKNEIREKMLKYIGKTEPGNFNQAVMEFGALQCKPGLPDCDRCPFSTTCVAYREGNVERFPVKSKSRKQKIRYFNYFVMFWKDEQNKPFLYLKKREEKDVWKNLYDFPLIETTEESEFANLCISAEWKEILDENIVYKEVGKSRLYKHILTHQIIFARFYTIQVISLLKPDLRYLPVRPAGITKYPIPRLIEEYLFENPVSD